MKIKKPIANGTVFGRLTVLNEIPKLGKYRYFRCRCECGIQKRVEFSNLISGRTISCGCKRRTEPNRRAHGLSHKVPEYGVWIGMKVRCKKDKDYAGRGIKVCERWAGSFENFYADMGSRPTDKHSIERKNNDGNYEPQNCCWATAKEQANNQRRHSDPRMFSLIQLSEAFGLPANTLRRRLRNGVDLFTALTLPKGQKSTNKMIEHDGTIRSVEEWADATGIPKNTLHWRIKAGWDHAKALETPVRSYP